MAGEALRELREESGIALSLARCSGSPCPSHAPPGSCAFCEHQKVFLHSAEICADKSRYCDLPIYSSVLFLCGDEDELVY